jgi:HEAT repeat protein
VTLPLGPAEGFSLHAIFQPLELHHDPLAAEDLDRKKRRPFLGERLEDEKNAYHSSFQRNEQEWADEKQRTVIAENGEDALTKSPQRRVVILGGPGTGKTTTLKHLTGCRAKEALTDPNAPIPIFLSLADLARSQKTLQSYLTDLVEELGVERSYAEILWKAIQAGQAFICLDSLDEVEPQRRQKMIEWVNAWAAEQGNTWVIGSRFTEYKGGSFKHGRFAEWELLPMDHQLRLELAERLLPELQRLLQSAPEPSQSPATFVKLLEDHPQAAAWGENPLLFSLAAVVFLRTGGLPASRAMLYQKVLDAIFETRETDLVRRKVLRHVLSDLALELYKAKGRTFSLDDLLALLPIIRQRQHENWITEEMARRIVNSGLLDVLARETYSFRHQTFQEYLAAVELALRLTHRDQIIREEAWKFAWGKRTYSRWTEILRLMVGVLYQQPGNKGKLEAQHWLQELVGQRSIEEGDPGDLGLALALKSLTEIPEEDEPKQCSSIGQLQHKIVSIWLDELLRTGYDPLRRTKWWRLRPLSIDVFYIHGREVDKALEHLIKTLWSKNKDKRESASELLRELGQRVPLKQLLVALNDPDARVRVAAIKSLMGQGDRVPLEHLLDALHDQDESVRRAAIEALGEQGERVPLEHLLGALHDKDESVRRAAVAALGKQGERTPLEHLLNSLHDQDSFVRRAAVTALGKQGERTSLEHLLDALHDENWVVRMAAVEALGRQGERVHLEHLLGALHDQDHFVRWAAVEALGRQGERVHLEHLLGALHDQVSFVRIVAVAALGEQGERVPLEHLLDALHDKDESVRRAAVAALRKQGERVPLEHLLNSLYDENWAIRGRAVAALGEQGERIPLEHLLDTLHDKDESVRIAAVAALGKQGERVPLEHLLDTLHDKDESVRIAAVAALGKQGERVPLEHLLDALHDKDESVRIAAVAALGEQGERVPLEHLLDALHDKNWAVRKAAVEAGKRAPLEYLLDALHDKDESVRIAAVAALGEQGDRIPLEHLLDALHDKDESVRSAAVTALGKQGEHIPLEYLLDALHDQDSFVRRAAVAALGKQGERVPLEYLLDALHDKDESVRSAAVIALGKQGERTPLEHLLNSLHDQDSFVRRAAVTALGEQGEHAPLEYLLDALHDQDSFVRIAAVTALGKQGERVPLEHLLDALHDDNDVVRQEAVQTLGEQAECVPLDHFLEAVGDEDKDVSLEGIKVLSKIAPDALSRLADEAIAILNGQPAGPILGSIAKTSFCKLAGALKLPLPAILDELAALLSWHHWQVRTNAAKALGSIRRNIPDTAIRRLLELRRQDPVRAVREAADDALAEILSLETGIEDD